MEPLRNHRQETADPKAPDQVQADDGFYFGLGVFETICVRQQRLLLEEYHKQRMLEGLQKLGIPLACGSWEELRMRMKPVMESFLQEYPEDKTYVLKVCATASNIVITARKNSYTEKLYEKGYHLRISPVLRNETSLFTGIKSLNYGDNILEKRRAKMEGFDEPVFLNRSGFVTEGATVNLFGVLNGELVTPKASCGLLPGTMRRYLMEHYPVKEMELTPEQIKSCTELFVTNAVLGIMPVSQFEDIVYPSRTVSRKLTEEYQSHIL